MAGSAPSQQLVEARETASLWYYEDATGTQQGPFPASQLRQWYEAGYLPSATKCAGSFYGDVPVASAFEAIDALWTDPVANAFGGPVVHSSVAAAGAPQYQEHQEEWGDDDELHESLTSCKEERRAERREATPYDRPSGNNSGGRRGGKGGGKGSGRGGGKGGGKGDERPSLAFGGGKGKGGDGGDPGAPRSLAYKLRYEAAKAAGLGRVGGGPTTGGGMATTRNPWDGRRAGA